MPTMALADVYSNALTAPGQTISADYATITPSTAHCLALIQTPAAPLTAGLTITIIVVCTFVKVEFTIHMETILLRPVQEDVHSFPTLTTIQVPVFVLNAVLEHTMYKVSSTDYTIVMETTILKAVFCTVSNLTLSLTGS